MRQFVTLLLYFSLYVESKRLKGRVNSSVTEIYLKFFLIPIFCHVRFFFIGTWNFMNFLSLHAKEFHSLVSFLRTLVQFSGLIHTHGIHRGSYWRNSRKRGVRMHYITLERYFKGQMYLVIVKNTCDFLLQYF